MKYRGILLFGAPGSGKGTVGKIIAEAGDHCHISSGDIFRNLSPDSEIGKIFHSYAPKGMLVPDEVTIEVWHTHVKKLIEEKKYLPEKQLLILDGIPRTKRQAELLEELVEIEKIVVLEAEDVGVFVERLKKRALIEGRADDAKEEVLMKRMDVYRTQTLDVLSHYKKEIISKVNANQLKLIVLRDVLSCIIK